MNEGSRVLALSSIFLSSVALAADYSVSTVDFPGAEGRTSIAAINAEGRVVGTYGVSGTRDSFGFSEKSGTVTAIGNNLPCEATRCRTAAALINASGDIAGQFSSHVDFPGAFVQTANQIRIITPPGYPNTAVTLGGLNDQGTLVGCYSTPEGNRMFTELRGHFASLPLPFPSAASACITDINNRGQGIGIYSTEGGAQHAFVQTSGKLKSFDVPAGWGSETNPVALNDNGTIIGLYSSAADLSTHGFLRVNQRLSKIDYPGAASTFVSVINNRGQIAGVYLPAEAPAPTVFSFRAFVLINGQYTELSLPGPAQSVTGISERGEIVGTYYDTKCTSNCGTHGFRAVPN